MNNTSSLTNSLSILLRSKNLTIATAESCTGGMLASYLTNISGSSAFFDRGVITYSNQSKVQILGVKQETINTFGAVSKEAAEEMAQGIKKMSCADIGISITGIAGPTGDTSSKPIGLVFIGIAQKTTVIVKEFSFSGTRIQIKKEACRQALRLVLNEIQ